MTQNATPAVHQPTGTRDRAAAAREAGQQAAERARAAPPTSTEGAVEAGMSIAAERAAARDAGKPLPPAHVEPVAQHDAPLPAEDGVEAAEAETEAPKETKLDLNVRLKRKQRERELEIAKREQNVAKLEQEWKPREETFKQWQERQARLDKLKAENDPRWFEEVGMTPELHKQYIKSKLAEGKPEAQVLRNETELQKTQRELAELKQSLEKRDQFHAAEQARSQFVQTAKTDDFPIINSVYGDDVQGLLDYAENFAQPRFRAAHNRFGTHQELLFNIECIEAAKIARATGNEKLAKAVAQARETGNLKAVREAFGKPKPADKQAPAKKSPPGPAAQTRVSQPSGDGKPMSPKEKRARAAAAGQAAADRARRGEDRMDPVYLGGTK